MAGVVRKEKVEKQLEKLISWVEGCAPGTLGKMQEEYMQLVGVLKTLMWSDVDPKEEEEEEETKAWWRYEKKWPDAEEKAKRRHRAERERLAREAENERKMHQGRAGEGNKYKHVQPGEREGDVIYGRPP